MNILAYTPPEANMPPYVSINLVDGTVSIIVRSTKEDGSKEATIAIPEKDWARLVARMWGLMVEINHSKMRSEAMTIRDEVTAAVDIAMVDWSQQRGVRRWDVPGEVIADAAIAAVKAHLSKPDNVTEEVARNALKAIGEKQ
jgi:hypothetical protein